NTAALRCEVLAILKSQPAQRGSERRLARGRLVIWHNGDAIGTLETVCCPHRRDRQSRAVWQIAAAFYAIDGNIPGGRFAKNTGTRVALECHGHKFASTACPTINQDRNAG